MPINFTEDHQSQLPALSLLIKLGYTYLSPEEALIARGGKSSNVILEEILGKQLGRINKIKISGQTEVNFSPENLEKGILALKDIPYNEGFINASRIIYDRMRFGHALEQSINGDKKSFTLQYIDWKHPERNVFHVTEEFSVLRSGRADHYRPDLVLFVNGIPLCVIECKSPQIGINKGIEQHLRNQQSDGIRNLYIYTHLLLSVSTLQAQYATTDTKKEFWGLWKAPKQSEKVLAELLNTPLSAVQSASFLALRDAHAQKDYRQWEQSISAISEQDRSIYHLCQPEKLLEICKDYIVFESERYKKIARYQQYYAIKKTLNRIAQSEGLKRQGGVIWHTQGSGKSLTMAMLARKIFEEVKNPKIVLVTDRTDLDGQISDTFRHVDGVSVENAGTGKKLIELLKSKSDSVVTTVINKFETAVETLGKNPLTDPNIFVLIDEGHRTQYGTFSVKMQQVLPNACFIAFTGTPLMKKEKNTAEKFGGIIDAYTLSEAVADGAIVPIFYEGRFAVQDVNQNPIDKAFERVSEPLTEYQKSDLKQKYSRADLIGKTEQKIDEIARDVSAHFVATYGADKTQESAGFKAMFVAPNKKTAIKFKNAFDLIGTMRVEVIMSPPDVREGTEDIHEEAEDDVVAFWKRMEDKHGKGFEKILINEFKNTSQPDMLIVVDKLLTGFDVPQVAVMYICKPLKEHSLLQAIARVNRVYEGKEYGLIVDYQGILGDLDEAMSIYSAFNEFEQQDILGSLSDVNEKIAELPQLHSQLNDLFKSLVNRSDLVLYSIHLSDVAIREDFYKRFTAFVKCLKLAFSTLSFEQNTSLALKAQYRQDAAFYAKLRNSVLQQYGEESKVDFKKFEKQLQKLLDQHVTTEEVIRLTEMVDILDRTAFAQALAQFEGTRAKAEAIASQTAKHITERMEEDPVFYKKLSELIQQTIADLRANRISELAALENLKMHQEAAIHQQGNDIPEALTHHQNAVPFFRLLRHKSNLTEAQSIDFALMSTKIMMQHICVDWHLKVDVRNRINFDISEYLIDEYKFSIEEAEDISSACLSIAEKRYSYAT